MAAFEIASARYFKTAQKRCPEAQAKAAFNPVKCKIKKLRCF